MGSWRTARRRCKPVKKRVVGLVDGVRALSQFILFLVFSESGDQASAYSRQARALGESTDFNPVQSRVSKALLCLSLFCTPSRILCVGSKCSRVLKHVVAGWLQYGTWCELERADVCKVAFKQIFTVLLSCCVLPSAFVRALQVFEVFAVFVRLYYIGILLSFPGSPSCVTTGSRCGLLLQPSASGCAAGRWFSFEETLERTGLQLDTKLQLVRFTQEATSVFLAVSGVARHRWLLVFHN